MRFVFYEEKIWLQCRERTWKEARWDQMWQVQLGSHCSSSGKGGAGLDKGWSMETEKTGWIQEIFRKCNWWKLVMDSTWGGIGMAPRFMTCAPGEMVEPSARVYCIIRSGMGEDCGFYFYHVEPEVLETSECVFHRQFDICVVSSEERTGWRYKCVSTKC